MNDFGVSFLPNGDQRYQRPGEAPSSAAPQQEAIKTLSLRVPRVVGANPVTPLALLEGQGGGGLGEGMIQQLLRLLGAAPSYGQQGPSSLPGGVGITGGTSPFAAPQGAFPTTFGGGPSPAPGPAGPAAPSGGGGIPMPHVTVSGPAEPMGRTGGVPGNPEDFWSQAQNIRTQMGRLT